MTLFGEIFRQIKKHLFQLSLMRSFKWYPKWYVLKKNNFWPYFWVRVPPCGRISPKKIFFKTCHFKYHLKDLIKLSWNKCFLYYFDLIFANTSQKYVFFWHKLTVMSKKPTGSVKIIPKTRFFFSQLYASLMVNLNLFTKTSYLSYIRKNFTFGVRFY